MVAISRMVIQTCFRTGRRNAAPPSNRMVLAPNSRMIWFSAESALMSISPSACGPSARPTRRNTATSGILIFCANKAAMVPTARMRLQDSSVCLAISIGAELSNSLA